MIFIIIISKIVTDTDSLIIAIETKHFYKDISGDVKEKFDRSGYLSNHPSGIPSGFNKKKSIGCLRMK